MGVAPIRLKPVLYSWKIVFNTMLYMISVWLRTGSIPVDINRFQSHTD